MGSKASAVLALARERGVLRPVDLAQEGMHPRNLSVLYERGLLIRTGWGLYALPDGEWTEHHTLVEAARRVPGCVIGLASALRYHDLTTEMPHQVWIFISRRARKPRVDYPPVQVFRCEPERLQSGTIRPVIEGIEVTITNVPRTLVDAFRHRRALGMDVAISALRQAIQKRSCTPAEIASMAREHRAWNIMRPYLEALL